MLNSESDKPTTPPTKVSPLTVRITDGSVTPVIDSLLDCSQDDWVSCVLYIDAILYININQI